MTPASKVAVFTSPSAGVILAVAFLFSSLGLACKEDGFAESDAGYQPRAGDILFQALSKRIDLVVAIEGVTGSNYSHCGVIVKGDKGNWQVFESIGAVGSVPLKNWIARGRGGKFAAYRLREKHAVEVATLLAALPRYADRPYDVRYRMDDQFIYCSELVYKAYRDATGQPLGRLVKLGDLNWRPHVATIRKYEGGEPPLDREMITPIDLSRAAQLKKVFDNGMAEVP